MAALQCRATGCGLSRGHAESSPKLLWAAPGRGPAGPTDMGSGWATSRRCSVWFGKDKVIHGCNAKMSPCHTFVP